MEAKKISYSPPLFDTCGLIENGEKRDPPFPLSRQKPVPLASSILKLPINLG